MASLAERLGYPADALLLIVSCDDLGLTHSSNRGCYDALRYGLATTAALMVPCPWAREAAAAHRGEDVGVQLTINAEQETYRWGPLTHAPSLLDGDGGFPRTLEDAWEHADLDEVRRECRAQIERAIVWGFDVTHLDCHLRALELRADFFDVYLELAADFGLPIRLGNPEDERLAGFPFRRLADEEGVVFPDASLIVRSGGLRRLERAIYDLDPGVTAVHLRPAIDSDEFRAACQDWASRVEDHRALAEDAGLRELVGRAGATLIGYRELRELQRKH